MIKALLLDIEGTVGDIAFVRDVLFPYARKRLRDTLRLRWSEPHIAAIVADARVIEYLGAVVPSASRRPAKLTCAR